MELAVEHRELHLVLCGNLDGWSGFGGGREIVEAGDICIRTADSHVVQPEVLSGLIFFNAVSHTHCTKASLLSTCNIKTHSHPRAFAPAVLAPRNGLPSAFRELAASCYRGLGLHWFSCLFTFQPR